MSNQYQLRVGGKTIKWYSIFSQEVISDFMVAASDNKMQRVEVVQVAENAVLSSYEYCQFERHFEERQSK